MNVSYFVSCRKDPQLLESLWRVATRHGDPIDTLWVCTEDFTAARACFLAPPAASCFIVGDFKAGDVVASYRSKLKENWLAELKDLEDFPAIVLLEDLPTEERPEPVLLKRLDFKNNDINKLFADSSFQALLKTP